MALTASTKSFSYPKAPTPARPVTVRKFDGQAAVPDTFRGKRPVDPDRLSMVHRTKAAHSAHLALFQLQDLETPEDIVMGASVLFAALVQRSGLDPEACFQMGMKVLRAPEEFDGDRTTNASLESLKDWVAGRIMAAEITTA